MIDPRTALRGLLKILSGGNRDTTKGEGSNSLSINTASAASNKPVIKDIYNITPDRAKEWYKSLLVDPYKNTQRLTSDVSVSSLETPDTAYRVDKTRYTGGAKPLHAIEFGMPGSDGTLSYNRDRAQFMKAKAEPGTELRFQQDYNDRLRRNALKAMLGRQIDDIRPGSSLRVSAYDSDKGGANREALYSRGTKGALAFKDGVARARREGRNTWTNIFGEKVTFDPKDLKKPLKDMSKQFITRYMLRMMRINPVVNAIMTGADLGQYMNENLEPTGFRSGRGEGRSALNDS